MNNNYFKSLANSVLSIFYPCTCILCKQLLIEGEEHFCLHCFYKMPRTNYHRSACNAAKERFIGKIPCHRVSSFLHYSKDGEAQKIIAEIKYKRNLQLGKWMGELMAKEMLDSSFFDGIDVIVPIPLHRKKQKSRGYNQAEEICKGISLICNIPVDTNLFFRKKENSSQTKKGIFERWLNTKDIFGVRNDGSCKGKHILIVDDVLTTGSTMEACVQPVLNCENIKISILTLAIAQ